MCSIVTHIIKLLFSLVWDGLKALLSPFKRPKRSKDFGEDICLITGAAQGLGKALALELAKRDAVLVLWDIKEEKLREVADEIQNLGSKVYWYVCDCSNREEVYEVAEKVKAEVGDVSVLINNAGFVAGRTLMESNDEDIERTFKINTLCHIWTAKAFLPWMLENNHGHIVNIASILAYIGSYRVADYCSSKAACMAFSEGLRSELRVQKKTGVIVTCVCPYHINTAMFASVTGFFRPLKVEYAVERTLQAIEEKQFLVILPRLFYILVFLKNFFPTRAIEAILDLLQVNKALEGLKKNS